MRLRNEILKLSTRWKSQDPFSLNVTYKWTSPYEGLKWKRIDWPGLNTVAIKTECKPGLDFPYHLHEHHDEILIVIDGIAHVEIIKTEHILYPGDSIRIPKGILHRGVYPEGAKVLLFFKKQG